MPRSSKGARLYLRRRRGRDAAWVILDHGCELGTGAGKNDIDAAEKALIEHLARKRRPHFGSGQPDQVLIADVLSEYGEKYGPTTRRPELIGGAISKLVDFFGDKPAAWVTNGTCMEYVRWRTAQSDARTKGRGNAIKPSTARRELVVLGAAIRWCWKEGKLDRLIPVSLPPQASPRERH